MKNRIAVLFGMMFLSIAFLCGEACGEKYCGSLSTVDGGLEGLGSWVDPGFSSISWEVENMGGYYHYEYTLNVPLGGKDISHFIMEVSSTFTEDNLGNAWGSYTNIEIGDYTQHNGNPSIPGLLHGMKFDGTSGTALTVSFDSDRIPVWGDFYSKDGKDKKDKIVTQVWNSGFTVPDPTAPAASGSIDGHLLVPNTLTATMVVPEPSTLVLLGMGLLGLVAIRRRM